MNGREIIQALHEGRRVYSSAIVAMSPLWPNLAKQAGLDFVFVDTEHVPLDRRADVACGSGVIGFAHSQDVRATREARVAAAWHAPLAPATPSIHRLTLARSIDRRRSEGSTVRWKLHRPPRQPRPLRPYRQDKSSSRTDRRLSRHHAEQRSSPTPSR